MSNIINDRDSISDDNESLLHEIIRYHIHNIHTSQPCTVTSFNKDNQTVNVRPGVARDLKGQLTAIPILKGVPIAYPSGSDFSMTWPLKKGDTGIIVFSESSIDNWLENNTPVVNPQDTRMHSYSDAMFIPGIRKYSKSLDIDDKNVIIKNGLGEIEISPKGNIDIKANNLKFSMDSSGKFEINGVSGNFVDLLVSALEKISVASQGAGADDIAKLKLMKK